MLGRRVRLRLEPAAAAGQNEAAADLLLRGHGEMGVPIFEPKRLQECNKFLVNKTINYGGSRAHGERIQMKCVLVECSCKNGRMCDVQLNVRIPGRAVWWC